MTASGFSDLNEWWMDAGGLWLGVMPSVEEAGRVLQSSLAQGNSMSQTIPGQRRHAVVEHDDMLVAAMGARAGGTDTQMDTHTRAHAHKSHTQARKAHFSRVRMRSNVGQPLMIH